MLLYGKETAPAADQPNSIVARLDRQRRSTHCLPEPARCRSPRVGRRSTLQTTKLRSISPLSKERCSRPIIFLAIPNCERKSGIAPSIIMGRVPASGGATPEAFGASENHELFAEERNAARVAVKSRSGIWVRGDVCEPSCAP